MWRRSSQQTAQEQEGIQTYRREEHSLDEELKNLPVVTPLLNPSEPAAWSTAYESGSRFVNSSEVRDFAAEISRLVKEVDDTTSQGQRDIQIQLLHVEEQISKMSSISEAMGQLASLQALVCTPASTDEGSGAQLESQVEVLGQRITALQAAVDELSLQNKRNEGDPGPSLLPVSFQARSSLSKELAQEGPRRGVPRSP